jgi:quercetin dioxygenase-like cupin family protein
MTGARLVDLVPPTERSALRLSLLQVDAGDRPAVGADDADTLLYVVTGAGSFAFEDRSHPLEPGAAALVLARERATIEAAGGLTTLQVTVGPDADRHAPLGPRESVARLAHADAQAATGARSFQVLFGPQNGSARATLFVGFIPPGKAPWHYHLYDEIVWVPEGPGRLHREGAGEELGPGSAFRLRPREVHIVENSSAEREMTILGVFTPAGSPSAAYLPPGGAAGYTFAG